MSPLHRPEGPRLGFGTGGFSARGDRAQQVRLLHAALDAGITHIDTARLYGEGTAEGVVGEALRGRRDRVFLVSKAGISPPRNGATRRAMNKALALGRSVPVAGALVPQPQWSEPRFGQFEVSQVRDSLEQSLRQLRTDYLDLFMLHEVDIDHVKSGELVAALENWRKEGLFVRCGIASTREQTAQILAEAPGSFSTLQTSFSVFDGETTGFNAPDRFVITHSWLGAALSRFQRAFRLDPKLAEKAGRVIYADVRRPHRLARCLLEHALRANPDGQVLFSTSQAERIAGMVSVAEKPRMAQTQLNAMKYVVERILELERGPEPAA